MANASRRGEQHSGLVRVRIVVSGRVQGVSFRSSLREEARRFGVVGWVRNRADGSVEAMLQGKEETVERLIAWAHHGPPGAFVTRLRTEKLGPSQTITAFYIQT